METVASTSDYKNSKHSKIDAYYKKRWEETIKAGPIKFSNVCDIYIASILKDVKRNKQPSLDEICKYGNIDLLNLVLKSFKYTVYTIHNAMDVASEWNNDEVFRKLKSLYDEIRHHSSDDEIPDLVIHREGFFRTTLDEKKKYKDIKHTDVLDKIAWSHSCEDEKDITNLLSIYCKDNGIIFNLDDDASTVENEKHEFVESVIRTNHNEEIRLIMETTGCYFGTALSVLKSCNFDMDVARSMIISQTNSKIDDLEGE